MDILTFKRRITLLSLVSLILVITGGCDALRSHGQQTLDIRTNLDRYSMSGNEKIVFEATNTSGQTLFQYTPPDAVLEMRENGSWKEVGPWYATITVLPSAEAVPPGESLVIPDIPAGEFQYFDFQPGTYRVKTHIYRSEEMKEKLPLEQRVSNPFELTE